jgi:hypothetical protein
VLFTSKGYLMGLITKKDVIRNMAALEEAPDDEDEQGEGNEVLEAQEGELLVDEDDDETLSQSHDSA